MNELEVPKTSVVNFLNSITKDLEASEYSNFLIVYFILTIIAVVSISMRRFSAEKTRRNRVSFKDSCKGLNDRSVENWINESPVKSHENTIHEKRLTEMYLAADKCFIGKYDEECRKLAARYPHLINAKLASTGQTPFHRVCFHGNVSLVKFMLAKGADPYLNSDAGESPICLAVHYYINQTNYQPSGSDSCLEILRRAGCSLGDNGIWYNILLRLAIRADNKSLTKWLLTEGGYAHPRRIGKLQKEFSVPWDLKL